MNVDLKKHLEHKSPTYCQGHSCEVKDICLRYRHTGWRGGINAKACEQSGYSFLIEKGTEKADQFATQGMLYLKEQHPFSLDWGRYTAPTNSTMYDCYFCKAAGRKHSIEEKPTPEELRTRDSFYMRYGHIRVCSGCGRYDGPWVACGDD